SCFTLRGGGVFNFLRELSHGADSMNLQVLVAVAEIVSASAVTFTLRALIISIRQNTRSEKALVVDALAAAIASINVPAMESYALGYVICNATVNWGSASRE